MIHALLHDGSFKDTPRGAMWDIYFNPVIRLQCSQILQYHIHILSKATNSLENWKSYILSEVIRIGSLATLKELNRILKRYEGIILDRELKAKIKNKMWEQIKGQAKTDSSWMEYFAQFRWAQNYTQAKLEWALNRLLQNYWNQGRLGPSIPDDEADVNLLFLLTPYGDCKRADFRMNPILVFKSYVDIHNTYVRKEDSGASGTHTYSNLQYYEPQMQELLGACMAEFINWGSFLRTASSYKMVHISVVFSEPMEYLHEIRMLYPPNSAFATCKIIQEIYSPNCDGAEFDGPENSTYTSIDARYAAYDTGIWNLLLGAAPALESPGGLVITESNVVQTNGGHAPAHELFGVDEDTICTLFGFRILSLEDRNYVELSEIFGTTDIRIFQNGRYAFTDPGTWNIDLRANHARLDFEYDEILGVVINIWNSMFETHLLKDWKNSAATFSLMMYCLRSQSVSRLDWSKLGRDVLAAVTPDLARNDEFWVHQHIHGLALEKVWQCNGEEVDVKTEKRLVCITILVPNTAFRELDDQIQNLRRLERSKNLDPLFEVRLSHLWKGEECNGHRYRNLRVSHGTLMEPDGWKKYPMAENNFHVYTGAPILKCVRDGPFYLPKGWIALSFLTGLGLQDFGLKEVSYDVLLVNGFDRGIEPVVLQSGVLRENNEKDVMCFSRSFPVLVEDRTSKDNKRNRKKKKKKSKTQGGERVGVEGVEVLNNGNEENQGAKDEENKGISAEQDDGSKGEKDNIVALKDEGAAKEEVSVKEDGNEAAGGNDTETEKTANLVYMGGYSDERSIFLRTRQGFDLRLLHEELGEDNQTETTQTISAGASSIEIRVQFQGGQGSRTFRLGLDGADDSEVEDSLDDRNKKQASQKQRPHTNENKKPTDTKQVVSSSLPESWKPTTREFKGPRSFGWAHFGRNVLSRGPKGKAADRTVDGESKRLSAIQARSWDTDNLGQNVQDLRHSQDTMPGGADPDAGAHQQDLVNSPVRLNVTPIPAAAPPSTPADFDRVPRVGNLQERRDTRPHMGIPDTGKERAYGEPLEEFDLSFLTLDILGDDMEEPPLEILRFDILGDDEPRLIEDELPGRLYRRGELYYWGQKENFDRSKTADKAPYKFLDSHIHRAGTGTLLNQRGLLDIPGDDEDREEIISVTADDDEDWTDCTDDSQQSQEDHQNQEDQQNQGDQQNPGNQEKQEVVDDNKYDWADGIVDEPLFVPPEFRPRPPRAPEVNMATFTFDRSPRKKNACQPLFRPPPQDTIVEEPFQLEDWNNIFTYQKLWAAQQNRRRNPWKDRWGCDTWAERRKRAPPHDSPKPPSDSLKLPRESPKPLLKTQVPVSGTVGKPGSVEGTLERNKWWKDKGTSQSRTGQGGATGSNPTWADIAKSGTPEPNPTSPSFRGPKITGANTAKARTTNLDSTSPSPNLNITRPNPAAANAAKPQTAGPNVAGPKTVRWDTAEPSTTRNTPNKVSQRRSDKTRTPGPVGSRPAPPPQRKRGMPEKPMSVPWSAIATSLSDTTLEGTTPSPETAVPDKANQKFTTVQQKVTESGVKYTPAEAPEVQSGDAATEDRATLKLEDTREEPDARGGRKVTAPEKRLENKFAESQTTRKLNNTQERPLEWKVKPPGPRAQPAQASLGGETTQMRYNPKKATANYRKANPVRILEDAPKKQTEPTRNAAPTKSSEVTKKTINIEDKTAAKKSQSAVKAKPLGKENEEKGLQDEGTAKQFMEDISKKTFRKLFGKRQRAALPAALKGLGQETTQDVPEDGSQVGIERADSEGSQTMSATPQEEPEEPPREDPKEVPREANTQPTRDFSLSPPQDWLPPPKKAPRKKHRNRGRKEAGGGEPQAEDNSESLSQKPGESSAEPAPENPWQKPTEAQYSFLKRPSQVPRDDPWEVVQKGSKAFGRKPSPEPAEEVPRKLFETLGSLTNEVPEESAKALEEVPKGITQDISQEVPEHSPEELTRKVSREEALDERGAEDLELGNEDIEPEMPTSEGAQEVAMPSRAEPNKRKRKKQKGKKKEEGVDQEVNDDESWYTGEKPESLLPEGSQTEPTHELLPIGNMVEAFGEEDAVPEDPELKSKPLICKTKIRFDESRKHIISRTATVTIPDLVMAGLDENYRFSAINNLPIQDMIIPSGIPGLYYFITPMTSNLLMLSIPCASGFPDEVRWMGSRGIELEFITPGFKDGKKVDVEVEDPATIGSDNGDTGFFSSSSSTSTLF
ncbi:hypothetical protein TWF192_005288 [Orbilia oligospora]|uniref:Uncharacterized protein n=1 Tax=Orbilia oligospora TaxID=2813651 RepID=A0A6G1M9D0_ORBOL|nr:hypothetical protein TWF191_008666 [Orbilia oligospora]KAF3250266.1 hypothetical protein TWF192_005288 [Orbilia oligospora]